MKENPEKSMGDFLRISNPRKSLESNAVTSENGSKQHAVAPVPVKYSQKALKSIASVDNGTFGVRTAVEIGQLLLKVAALEMIRRFSTAHFPLAWCGLQALQILRFPPFKWIMKWAPFKGLEKCIQPLSMPVLLLSIATCFSDQCGHGEGSSCSPDDSRARIDRRSDDDSQARIDQQSESSANSAFEDISCNEEVPKGIVSNKWMSELLAVLQEEGVILPERINQDELQRFYNAANGNISCFLSSVKRTIKWRQKFNFHSVEELEPWSNMVFWHGRDVKRRPCLFVRVGLAWSSITSEDRSILLEVVVSQIEYGVLNLVDSQDAQITVVMDCDGLTPFRLPMHMMRSCAILLQDHYPNRLAALFMIGLSPVFRLITQTLFQVLSPATQRKLKIEGDDYRRVLSEYLEALPSFLGGDCSCPKCSGMTCSCPKCSGMTCSQNPSKEANLVGPSSGSTDAENTSSPPSTFQTDDLDHVKCVRTLKAAIVGIITLLLCMAFILGVNEVRVVYFNSRGG
ncbi:hypothetical protein Ancab_001513 [Ancistrocladus abbreviatus]